jgi:hypothetical protein
VLASLDLENEHQVIQLVNIVTVVQRVPDWLVVRSDTSQAPRSTYFSAAIHVAYSYPFILFHNEALESSSRRAP